MSTQRQPKGIPVGGQFAANSHDEAGSYLPSESIHMFSVAGREYGIEKTGGGDDEYHVIQIDDERRPEIAVFESSSDDEDEIEDEARTALAEARGDNLDSAERLELGVGTVTIRLEPGDREEDIALTLGKIRDDIENGITSGYYPTWSVGAEKDEEVASSHTVTIELDGNRAEDTLGEVVRSIEDGNTSGYYPTWEIDRSSNIGEEHAESIAGALTYSEVRKIDGGDDSENFVIVDDPAEPTLYVICVDKDGDTMSANIQRSDFEKDERNAVESAEWETGYEF